MTTASKPKRQRVLVLAVCLVTLLQILLRLIEITFKSDQHFQIAEVTSNRLSARAVGIVP